MITAFSTGLSRRPTKAVAPVIAVTESDILVEGSRLQAANASRQKAAATDVTRVKSIDSPRVARVCWRAFMGLSSPPMKKALISVVLAIVALIGVVGAEIVLALRRDYLPTEAPLEIGGVFGPPSAPKLEFVVLGDSTAAGVGAGSAARAYPTLLARRLAAGGRRVELTSFGVSGARAVDVLREQVPMAMNARPDLVFLAIGANDVIHLTPLEEIDEDLRAALDRLRSTGAVIVTAGVPDMRAAAFLEPLRSLAGWRGNRVSAVIYEAARASEVPAVRLAEQTAKYFVSEPDKSYSVDDFHPGPGGYERWADAIYPILERALATESAGAATGET